MNAKILMLALMIGIFAGHNTNAANTDTPGPNLCDLGYDGNVGTFGMGWLCMECGVTQPCDPQSGSGWLCCGATGVCVQVVTANECDTGILGWCEDISVTKLRNGIEVAICENES